MTTKTTCPGGQNLCQQHIDIKNVGSNACCNHGFVRNYYIHHASDGSRCMCQHRAKAERRVPWKVRGYGPSSRSPYDPYPMGRRLLRHDQDRRGWQITHSGPAPDYSRGAMEAANALSHIISPGSWKLDLRDEAARIITQHTHDQELIECLEEFASWPCLRSRYHSDPADCGKCATCKARAALRAAKGE